MQFSLSRIKRLIFRDWIVYRKPALYSIFLVVLSSLFIFWLPTIEDQHSNHKIYDTGFWAGWYISYLFIGGLLLASIIFWEFKSPASRIQYLSLPASNLEKLVSRSIYPLIIYPVLVTVILTVAISIAKATSNSEALDSQFRLAIPFIAGGYLCLVSLMLVFSIAFNKYVAPKSVIASLIIFFLFLGIFYLIFRLTMHELFDGFSFNRNFTMKMENDVNLGKSESFISFVKFIIWIVIPGFFCTVAYFKMKEKQV